MDTLQSAIRALRLLAGLAVVLMTLAPAQMQANDDTNRFLFLTLHLKSGAVTLEKALVVSGTLKPQLDSTEAEPLLIALEDTGGKQRWSLMIDDPSILRCEHEDPEHVGALKSKLVKVDDVEFIVRTPMTPGVRHIAIHRKGKNNSPAAPNASPAADKLLARIELPKEATK